MFTHVFAGIPVVDRDAATRWYARFTGRPADLIPNEDEAAWQISEAGWIYVIADASRAGSALHALLVEDLDACVIGLAERGIAAGPVEAMDNGVRCAIVTDPDGNRLKLGQPPAQAR
jgi:hypothetical protein